MVSMSFPDLWIGADRLLTVDDLADLPPDDDRRYELDDGVLVVCPAPGNVHQLAVTRLVLILTTACPAHLTVLAGVGMNVTRHQHRIPDVAVVPADCFDSDHLDRPAPLAVEVSSASTRLYDMNRKKDVYESFGVPAYWIVEPARDTPRLIAFELRDRRYEQVADVTGDEEFSTLKPFAVAFRPATLVGTGPLPAPGSAGRP